VSAEQRECPQCGTPFTWTTAAPRQKYCSTRCKHRWHQARRGPRRRRGRKDPTADVARPPVPTTQAAATTGDGTPSQPAAGTAGEAGLTAAPACPHCRKPVALVAWLVPPAAAAVKEPPRHADTIRDFQQPTVIN
jgi:endogenous inhibitor of DNA gyrase (YacG/DUF329 family)